MVKDMINNNSYYKGQDILENNYRMRMKSYFNPYEYNIESNLKDIKNSDILNQKSKSHIERNIVKK